MTRHQRNSVFSAIAVLVFFLVLSFIINQWGLFLWGLLPAFIVLMTTFTTNTDKKNTGR